MVNVLEAINPLTAATAADPSAMADMTTSMQWIDSSLLRGCNIYHDRTVVRVLVDLGALHRQTSMGAGREFIDLFIARFWDPAGIPPTAPQTPPFLDGLRSTHGMPYEQLLLEAILAIERRLAFIRLDFVPISMARAESIGMSRQPGLAQLIWESRDPALSRAAARLALTGLTELLPERLRPGAASPSEDFEASLAALCQRAARRPVSASTAVIVLAAHLRGVPYELKGGPHLQLGHGAAQREVYSSTPAETPLGAAQLSRNKRRTLLRLAEFGLPVTQPITITSVEEALAAAEDLGYPVVVKPMRSRQAGGVSAGITSAEEIPTAFAFANALDAGVIIENFVRGTTYRLLVVGGRFVAALSIAAPSVMGDGVSRIDELIEATNRDPMRDGIRLEKIEIDAELQACLARGGHTLADVPPAGTEIKLRAVANIAIGGVHTDVTDLAHPTHRELAEHAARVIGLSVAGIDVVSLDIGRSCAEVGARIIEVNARPGLEIHAFPRYGRPRDVGGAVVDLLFPPGTTGRIPTALVIGSHGAGVVADALDDLLRERGSVTGLITPRGAFIANQPVAMDQPAPHEALTTIWRDPRPQSLVMAMSPRQAVAIGLAIECADAVALLVPDGAKDDAEVYARAVALAVRVARAAIVVDAGNQTALQLLDQALAMGKLTRSHLVLASKHARGPAIDAHLVAGGTAVLVTPDREGGLISVRQGKKTLATRRRGGAAARDVIRPGTSGAPARRMALALDWVLCVVRGEA